MPSVPSSVTHGRSARLDAIRGGTVEGVHGAASVPHADRLANKPNPLGDGLGDRVIPLTRGLVTVVDAEDFRWFGHLKWFANKNKADKTYYARRLETRDGRLRLHLLHREILAAPQGMQVDHINGDGLDNRRSNLRLATPAQQARNRGKHDARMTSRFKGVSWNANQGAWKVAIYVAPTRRFLGYFDDEIAAAKAYDRAAVAAWGEYARTNFGSGAA